MPWLQLREVLEASRFCNWVLKENFMAFDRGNSPARQNSFGFGDRDRTESQSAVAPGNFSEAELIAMIPSLFASVGEIGRASCRERVCQYVLILGVAGSLKKKQ